MNRIGRSTGPWMIGIAVTLAGFGCGSEDPAGESASAPASEPAAADRPESAATSPGPDGNDAAVAPDVIPPLRIENGDDGMPRVVIDADAYARFCQANELPPPPGIDAIDPVGYAMIHAAVERVVADRSVATLAGLAFLHDGNDGIEPAAELYAELVELEPEEFAFHHLRGRALATLGRADEAIAALRRATEVRDDIAATWFRLGELELASGDDAAATTSFARYAELRPDDGLADFALGRLDAVAGRYAEALPRLEAAVAARPQLAPAWLLLAQARARTGDAEGGLAASERSRELAGTSAVSLSDPVETEMYRRSESVAYLQAAMNANNTAGRYDEAYALATKLAARRPGNALVIRNLAVFAKRLGRPGEAIQHGEQAVRFEPDRPRNHTTLAELYRDVGRMDDAVASALRAVALDPDSEVPRIVLAGTLLAAGRAEDALIEASAAVERAPERIEALSVQAAVLGALGRDAEARAVAVRVLEIQPGNGWATGVIAELDRRAAEAAGEGAEPGEGDGEAGDGGSGG